MYLLSIWLFEEVNELLAVVLSSEMLIGVVAVGRSAEGYNSDVITLREVNLSTKSHK